MFHKIRVMIAQDFVLQGDFVKEWRSYSYARLNEIFIRNQRPARGARQFMKHPG
jgi:hypothetical protein